MAAPPKPGRGLRLSYGAEKHNVPELPFGLGEDRLNKIAGPVAAIFVACLVLAPVSYAVTPEQAESLYRAGNWPEAEKAYRELMEEAQEKAVFKYRLAVALRNQGKVQAAQMWLDEAEGGGVPDAFIEVERARLLAADGNRAGAIRALTLAADKGYSNPDALRTDDALSSLRDHPGFEDALERMDRNRVPCEYIPEFSQFDFWVGDWRVTDPGGGFQGSNRIEKTQGGCLVLENWVSASGTTGTSMNFYDLHAKEWVQIWVSPGLQLEIRGGLVGDSMVLTGHVHYVRSGDHRPFRGTWTPLADGVVRQHFEESLDGGNTWATWFDGYYHPQQSLESDSG